MPLLNYNGVICSDEELLSNVQNRALRYGEGLIETMLWQEDRIRLQTLHEKRAQESLALLGFPEMPVEEWREALYKTALVSQELRTGILRTQFFRDDGMEQLQYMIELLPLPQSHGAWPLKGLQAGISRQVVKSPDLISGLKTTSRLGYLIAAREAAQQEWDDALLRNPAGRLAESTISNVWIIKNKTMTTPPLSEGCIAGVFRRFLIEKGSVAGIAIQENPITEDDLRTADEIFFTNAIRGIQPVSVCEGQSYPTDITQTIFEALSTE